jgi:Tol biopolymer transport system component
LAALKSYIRHSVVVWVALVFGIVITCVLGGLDNTLPIAGTSERRDNYEIYVWDLRTGVGVNLSKSPANDLFPTWSTDGLLAWVSRLGEELDNDIYVWGSHTGEVVKVTQYPTYDMNPQWSTDGLLAWHTRADNIDNLYVWDSHTGEVVNASQSQSGTAGGVWSTDGQLAWRSYNEARTRDIYVWDSHTGDVVQVTQNPGDDVFAVWLEGW